jgi:hypothetical protein
MALLFSVPKLHDISKIKKKCRLVEIREGQSWANFNYTFSKYEIDMHSAFVLFSWVNDLEIGS